MEVGAFAHPYTPTPHYIDPCRYSFGCHTDIDILTCHTGVLLYVLMFGENPFYDAQDTVRADLHPPHFEVSSYCMSRK